MTRKLRHAAAIAGTLAGAMLLPASAAAQITDSFDTRLDLRAREDARPLREPVFAIAEATRQDPWTLSASLDAIMTSNVAATPDNEFGAAIASPTLSLDYAHVRPLAGWALSGGADVSADRYSRFGGDFNENAAGIRVSARRPIGHLSLDVSALATSRFEEDFSERTASLQDYGVELGGAFDANWTASLRTTYRASDDPGARRTAVRAAIARSFSARPFKARWSIEQRVQYAAYRDGRNDGRNDVFARTQLSGAWDLPNGFSAGFAARYAHTFSNRDAVESDIFEIAPSVGYARQF